jgi:hypothetical protein
MLIAAVKHEGHLLLIGLVGGWDVTLSETTIE